jgi:uncharacterized protein (DUF2267 family)
VTHETPVFEVEGMQRNVTLADLISAVIEVTEDEREVTAVVLQMLQSGSVRLRRRRPHI